MPQGLLLPGGTLPCSGPGAYPASWITGVTRAPGAAASSNLLISYDDYCVTDNADILTAEGFGLVEYDPAHNLLGLDQPGVRQRHRAARPAGPRSHPSSAATATSTCSGSAPRR